MKASELYEVLVKDPVSKIVFRELGQRLGLGHVQQGVKAGNFNAVYIKFRFQVPNVEHRVVHGLGRVPTGAVLASDLLTGTTLGGVQITSTRDADDTYLYLQSDKVATVVLLIW